MTASHKCQAPSAEEKRRAFGLAHYCGDPPIPQKPKDAKGRNRLTGPPCTQSPRRAIDGDGPRRMERLCLRTPCAQAKASVPSRGIRGQVASNVQAVTGTEQ